MPIKMKVSIIIGICMLFLVVGCGKFKCKVACEVEGMEYQKMVQKEEGGWQCYCYDGNESVDFLYEEPPFVTVVNRTITLTQCELICDSGYTSASLSCDFTDYLIDHTNDSCKIKRTEIERGTILIID